MNNNKKIDFLQSLIENDSIKLNQSASDWEESIKVCFEPLLMKNKIKNSYINSTIKSTKDHGPYYIICPMVAMPHSNPKDGALDNAFSLVTLKKPVMFDNQEVKLLIGFCALDSKTHLEVALPQIVAIFENPIIVDEMLKASNKDELIQIIKKINYFKYIGD